MRNRKLTWVILTVAFVMGSAMFSQSSATETTGTKWKGLVLFPDCQYPCGNNTGAPKCTC